MDQLEIKAVLGQQGDRPGVRSQRRHALVEDDFRDLIARHRHGQRGSGGLEMCHAVGGSFGGRTGRLLGGVQTGIVDGAGTVAGQLLGQGDVVLSEGAAGTGADERHGAENETAGHERHDQHGVAAQLTEQAGVVVVVRDGRHERVPGLQGGSARSERLPDRVQPPGVRRKSPGELLHRVLEVRVRVSGGHATDQP